MAQKKTPTQILAELENDLARHDFVSFKEGIVRIPFDKMPEATAAKIFANYLILAPVEGDFLRFVSQLWMTIADIDDVSFFLLQLIHPPSNLVSSDPQAPTVVPLPSLPIAKIRRIADLFLVTPAEFFEFLLEREGDPYLLTDLLKAEEIFQDAMTKETYIVLYEEALRRHSTTVSFFEERAKDFVTPAEIPFWVGDLRAGRETLPNDPVWLRPGPSLPTEDQILDYVPPPLKPANRSLDDIVELAISGLASNGFSLIERDSARDDLKSILVTNPSAAQTLLGDDLLSADREQLAQDADLLRLFGPVNPLVGTDLSSEHICARYGGCRMLTCQCFFNEDLFDEDLSDADNDWFTGQCDVCHQRIRERHHALRLPGKKGGWLSACCTWAHLRDLAQESVDSFLLLKMIDEMEQLVTTIGIQDRTYN